MIRLVKSLGADERGTSIIELALVAPMLCAMLVGMTDLARGYSTKLQLEQAGQRAIEKMMQTSFQTTAKDALVAEAATTAGVETSAVAVTYWLECNGVKKTGGTMDADYNSVCGTGEKYSRYLQVEITKVYTPMFAFKFAGAASNGTYTLKGKSGVRVQ